MNAETQRQRILRFLRENGTASTLEIRHSLDIMHPAARVQELRATGANIVTVRMLDALPGRKQHRVARYVLMASGV